MACLSWIQGMLQKRPLLDYDIFNGNEFNASLPFIPS